MSSTQQYKEYNKRLRSQVRGLQNANENLNKELNDTCKKLYEFRNTANYIKPKSNLWKYIWAFSLGFAIGIALMYVFR